MSFIEFIAESEAADKFLSDFIYGEIKGSASLEIRDELLHDYPYTKTSPLYRGLNFADEEQYRTFLKNTEHGTVLHTKSLTSWTTNRKEAENFAVTRPTYFIDHDLMQAEDAKRKNHDYMIGHAGIIIKMDAPKGRAVDTSLSKMGEEDEVIVMPGDYKISVHKTLIPFVSSIHDENYEDILNSLGSLDDGFNKQKLEHILFRFADFSDESRAKLWGLVKFKTNINTNVELRNENNLYVGYDVPDLSLYLYKWYLPEHQQIVRNALKNALSNISKKVHDITKKEDIDYKDLRIHASADVKLGELITGINAFKHIDNQLSHLYQELNSDINIRNINDLPKEEKIKAIKQFSNDIVQIIKNLQR